MARRAKGEGTIAWNEERQRWEGRLDLGLGPDGRRLRPKRTGATRSEVAEKLRALRADHDAGLQVVDAPKVDDVLDGYLAAKDGLQASTRERYRSLIDCHLRPGLGPLVAKDVRPDQIERVLAKMVTDGYAQDTIVDTRRQLRAAYTWALRRRLVSWSPAAVAEIPAGAARAKQNRRPLTEEDCRRFLAAARPERIGAALAVMAVTGMRPGEVSALTVGSYDPTEGTLEVTQAVKGGSHLRSRHMGAPKTAAGRRSMRIPAGLAGWVDEHLERLARERADAGRSWPTAYRQLMFVSANGTPIDPGNLRRTVQRVAAEAGIVDRKVRPYELRHTATSILAEREWHNEQLAELLGHSSTRTLDRHYRARMSVVEVAAGLDDLLSAGDPIGDPIGSEQP